MIIFTNLQWIYSFQWHSQSFGRSHHPKQTKKVNQSSILDCVAQTKTICLTEVKFSSTNLFEETLMSDTRLPSELQTMLRSCTQRAFYIIEKSLQRESNLRALELSISKDICVLECFWYLLYHAFLIRNRKCLSWELLSRGRSNFANSNVTWFDYEWLAPFNERFSIRLYVCKTAKPSEIRLDISRQARVQD